MRLYLGCLSFDVKDLVERERLHTELIEYNLDYFEIMPQAAGETWLNLWIMAGNYLESENIFAYYSTVAQLIRDNDFIHLTQVVEVARLANRTRQTYAGGDIPTDLYDALNEVLRAISDFDSEHEIGEILTFLEIEPPDPETENSSETNILNVVSSYFMTLNSKPGRRENRYNKFRISRKSQKDMPHVLQYIHIL